MGIDGIDIEATMSSKYLGKDQRAIDMFLEMWQPPATPLPEPINATVALPPTPEATEAPSLNEASESTTNASTANRSEPSKYLPSNATTVPTPPSEPSIPNAQCNDSSTATTETENTSTEASEAVSPSPTPPTNPNVQDSVVTEEQQQVDEYDLEEDVFDPASIVRDMVADDSAGRHLCATQQYAAEKETLIGKVIPTSAGLSWTVRNDILQSEVVEHTETKQPVGIKIFDFNNKTVSGPNCGQSRINLLHLLIHLWPGNWRQQLERLNKRIQDAHDTKMSNTRYGRVKKFITSLSVNSGSSGGLFLLLGLKESKVVSYGKRKSQKDMVVK